MSSSIDLNCDLGEYDSEDGRLREAAILPHVSSVNIACGLHAGDAHVMRRTMSSAAETGLALGAHPSLADRANFGRLESPVTPDEIYELTLYQLGASEAMVRSIGAQLNHVKPHGALYNMAARDYGLAEAIAQAVRDFDPGLVLFGLSGSQSILAGEALGLKCAREVFADRRYCSDGSLMPRSRPEALISDAEEAVNQVLNMLKKK